MTDRPKTCSTCAHARGGFTFAQIQESALKQVSLFGELQNALEQIEALKKEVSTLDVLLEECKMDWSGDVTQIKAEHKHEIEALQADAERYRLGREAEYVGLMPTFRTGKTWAEAMDAAYDAHIAARKGNV